MLQNAWIESGNLPPWALYDVVYMFAAAPYSDGTINTLYLTTAAIQQLIASRPAGKKVLVVIKDEGAYQFGPVTTPGMISTFVSNVTKFVNQWGFDGVVIDWESNVNVSQYNDLLARLRGNLGSKAIYMDAGDWSGLPSVAQASQGALTGVNVMCYDMDNGNIPSWFNSCVYSLSSGQRSCDSRMAAFSGVSSSKIVAGIPFYGRKWTNAAVPMVNGAVRIDNPIPFSSLIGDPNYNVSYQQYDPNYKGAYLSVPPPGNLFYAYSSPAWLKDSVAWAKGKGFAGMSAFVSNYDDSASTLGTALRAAIGGSIIPIPPQPTPQFPCTVTTKIAADGITATTTVTRP